MSSNIQLPAAELFDSIEDLRLLRSFTGSAQEFWEKYLSGLAALCAARSALLVTHEGHHAAAWRRVGVWPKESPEQASLKLDVRARKLADLASAQGAAHEPEAGKAARQGDPSLLMGVRLAVPAGEGMVVSLFAVAPLAEARLREQLLRLRLMADIALAYQRERLLRQTHGDVGKFAEVLDLVSLLNEIDRYPRAVMTFCNELASRYRCERVSLGWLHGHYIRIQGISQTDKFDRKMEAVQRLEAAMEETFDQNEELVWPPPKDHTSILRDHEAYAREQGCGHLVSLPLRHEDEPQGVIACERIAQQFSEMEMEGLRLLVDFAARRLHDLKRVDRWFGARLWAAARRGLARFLGIEHTFAKTMGVLVSLCLMYGLFGSWNYRVEGSFLLKTDNLAHLPAPFDGYIDEVNVKIGDQVATDTVLLTLDTRELLLEEAAAIANIRRYQGDEEKARAQNALADMKIARALKDQAGAQLDQIRYRLQNAMIRPPFDGIVAEGDLQKMLGAPVRKGDVLFKVARLDELYVAIELDERDVQFPPLGASGEIAFVSRPGQTYPIRIERMDPIAMTRDEGNIFRVRAMPVDARDPWWRPGMSGVAKINVGRRNILWIITHRTVDFFRLLLWW